MSMTKLLRDLSAKYSKGSCLLYCPDTYLNLSLISMNVEISLKHNSFFLCRHALLFEDMGAEYNIPLAANAKSVRDFDEGLTRGMCFL